jgi:NAD(P)-dependent dehydrogenase (short-subunit alcohol dehydrogenase family)
MAEVTDLQCAVVFLASTVSDYMTGADLLVDGGYVAW